MKKHRCFLFALMFLFCLSLYNLSWYLLGRPMWTTTDPKSPFYGMNHRDTAGSVNFRAKTIFPSSKDNWRQYFSQTLSSIKLFRKINPEKDRRFYTDSFKIELSQHTFQFGYDFFAKIISTDKDGRPKTFGGDYYRARLIKSDDEFPDGIPCRVHDSKDGTYSVQAPLLLEGFLTLEVTLVVSCEAIDDTIHQTEALHCWGHQYYALFESGEIMPCNVKLSTYPELKDKPVCDYSNPRNSEPWVCTKPQSANCTKIAFLAYGGPGRGSTIDFDTICRNSACLKKKANIINVVRSPDDKLPSSELLAPCGNQFHHPQGAAKVNGYFDNGQWQSLLCHNKQKTLSTAKQCLRNKRVFFVGDSTIRQFFYFIALNALSLTINGPDNSFIWQQPKVAYDTNRQNYNITLYYRAHGPPLQNPGPPETRPYISDTIIDLPIGGDGVFVVFNIGAHLMNYSPNIFLHRLRGIKEAIIQHHKVFPNTKFILRGLNVVYKEQEWLLYRYEILLRSVFYGMDNVLFLNLFDLSTVWPLEGFHPVDRTLEQQALLMLSYICS